MEPVKIEELKDQTEQNISTAEESASEAPSEEKKERLSFENRKLEKRLVRLCAQAITDFNLIEDGDKVMVCVSGGKDSYALLDALVRLQGRAPIRFELLAFCLNQHLPDFPLDRLIAHLEKIGVPFFTRSLCIATDRGNYRFNAFFVGRWCKPVRAAAEKARAAKAEHTYGK